MITKTILVNSKFNFMKITFILYWDNLFGLSCHKIYAAIIYYPLWTCLIPCHFLNYILTWSILNQVNLCETTHFSTNKRIQKVVVNGYGHEYKHALCVSMSSYLNMQLRVSDPIGHKQKNGPQHFELGARPKVWKNEVALTGYYCPIKS